ncbi:MAG: RNA methyltransferase [Deltaproteobacteria bacterium]|nr:RNA methyltransferase [Deltaproteobacteria bacterium]
MPARIEKPSVAQLKGWRKLTQEKYRRQEGLFLAEGGKVVDELLRSGRPMAAVLISVDATGRQEELWARVPAGVPIYGLTNRQWAALSQDPAPEGVMAVAVVPEPADLTLTLSTGTGPLLLLYQVNNPNNLGALLRTAHWFGFRTVLVSEGSCEATNPKVIRTSMGSCFHLTVIDGLDFGPLLAELRGRFRIVGSDVRSGVSPHPCAPATALLLGSESHGLPEGLLALTEERWRIPGAGAAESLSLPQAAAILMYECVRKT